MRVEQKKLDAIFMNCILIFMLQMLLSIATTFGSDGSAKQTSIMSKGNEGTIIFVARFISALTIHIQTIGEVLQGILFMQFTLFKMTTWRKRFPMLLISLM